MLDRAVRVLFIVLFSEKKVGGVCGVRCVCVCVCMSLPSVCVSVSVCACACACCLFVHVCAIALKEVPFAYTSLHPRRQRNMAAAAGGAPKLGADGQQLCLRDRCKRWRDLYVFLLLLLLHLCCKVA